jgi:anhydro-N-acetylmuramic acid kinase
MMSGSSVDGVDAALVRVTGCCDTTSFELVDFVCRSFTPEERDLVLDLFVYESSTVDKICLMNFVLGEFFAEAAMQVLEHAGVSSGEVDAVGVWPQMVYHLPGRSNPQRILRYETGAALQLGDLNVIAERTGMTAIGSFCSRDIAAGGNGAPLTGLGDHVLYHDPARNRVIQNIGGIANANYVPAQGGTAAVTGFDTGPGNMVIDEVVRHVTGGAQQFDRDGVMAKAGTANKRLLSALMQHPFIQAPPPKAAGREQFGERFTRQLVEQGRAAGLSDADLVATATALTVEAIATSYERFFLPQGSIDEVIVGGGGAYNPAILDMLRSRISPVPVAVDEDYGVSSFAKEAIYMALITNEVIMGHPNNVHTVTGAAGPVTMGLIAPAGTAAK